MRNVLEWMWSLLKAATNEFVKYRFQLCFILVLLICLLTKQDFMSLQKLSSSFWMLSVLQLHLFTYRCGVPMVCVCLCVCVCVSVFVCVCLCAADLITGSSGGNVSVPLTPVFPIWLVHTLSQQWQLFNQGTITHNRHTNMPPHTKHEAQSKYRLQHEYWHTHTRTHTYTQLHAYEKFTECENGFHYSNKLCIF